MGDARILVKVMGDFGGNSPSIKKAPKAGVDSFSQTKIDEKGQHHLSLVYDISADSTLRDIILLLQSSLGLSLQTTRSPDDNDDGEEEEDNNSEVKKSKPSFYFHAEPQPPHSKTISLTLYDCTYHPPKDITPSVIRYNEESGQRAITLQAMGWFPSGRLALCRSDDIQAIESISMGYSRVHLMDEVFEYSLPTSSMTREQQKTIRTGNKNVVKLNKDYGGMDGTLSSDSASSNTSTSRSLPSEIFRAVQETREKKATVLTRSEEPNRGDVEGSHSKQRRRRTERERCARLDETLKRLDSTLAAKKKKKEDNISLQVRRMLIKSRSIGDKKLRMEDRFYLEVVIIDESSSCPLSKSSNRKDKSEECCSHQFFSRVATAGKVTSSILRSMEIVLGDKETSEFLVIKKSDESSSSSSLNNDNESTSECEEIEFRRIPNTMPLDVAESEGHLSNFQRVVIRIFDVVLDEEGLDISASMSVLDTKLEVDGLMEVKNESTQSIDSTRSNTSAIPTKDINSCEKTHEFLPSLNNSELERQRFEKLDKAIQEYKEGGKKKKITNDKIRQMLMKSKAKGNKKSVKESDRFYLEVVVIDDSKDKQDIESSCGYIFLPKRSLIGSVIEAASVARNTDVIIEILIQKLASNGKKSSFQYFAISPSSPLRLCDAEKKGFFHSFGSIIIRKYPVGGSPTCQQLLE